MKTHTLPKYNFMQKFCKKSYVKIKNKYDKIFETSIGVKDVKKMHPKLKHFTPSDVGRILFKQSLRDDFPKSIQEMAKRVDKNPYVKGVTMYYNPKKQKIYKYYYNSDQCHVATVQQVLDKLLHNQEYMTYTAKVAKALNHE